MDENRGQPGANMAGNALELLEQCPKTRIHFGCPTFIAKYF